MNNKNLFFDNGRVIGIRHANNDLSPVFCGEGKPTCVIASLGMSYESDNLDIEINKAKNAIIAGADIITDHSVAGDIIGFQQRLISETNVPISYLTIYELLSILDRKNRIEIEKNQALDLVEEQIERGITLLTIHATANRKMLSMHSKCQGRRITSTSRGGAAILDRLIKTNKENVYWENFEDFLKIFKKHNVTLSLGTTYRPASVCDAHENDLLYWAEMEQMGLLVNTCINNEIPVMVEGIGHAPIHKIPLIIKKSKEICHNVPYRVLSVATDIALGLDHISSAIAIATAASNGADLATCITRAEHLGQPFEEDIIEGILAAKVAAHCADIAKLNYFEKDHDMSVARGMTGCRGIIDASINPKHSKESLIKYSRGVKEGEITCSMCGDRCALSYDLNRK